MNCQIANCVRFARETLHFPDGATLRGSPTVSVCIYHYVLLLTEATKPPPPVLTKGTDA